MSTNVTSERLAALEAIIETGMRTFIEVGHALLEIRARRLYREQGFGTFEDYCRKRWNMSQPYAQRTIDAAKVAGNLMPIGITPKNEAQARELARLTPEQQREVAVAVDLTTSTEADVHAKVEEHASRSRLAGSYVITLDQWNEMTEAERKAALSVRNQRATFTPQGDSIGIGWARWSSNPITGCLHNCGYCYARPLAELHYPKHVAFKPAIWPDRLSAPYNTRVPAQAANDLSYKNVFVCSMADLFGNSVPIEWINAMLETVRHNPQWNFLFLTKFPQRMAEFEYPDNAWLGTSVDSQARVKNAERAMAKVKAKNKWLSCEPMLEHLLFKDLSIFSWIVIGGASAATSSTGHTPEWHPPRSWVLDLTNAATRAGCAVYEKSNLYELRQDFPGHIAPEPVLPEAFGLIQLKPA